MVDDPAGDSRLRFLYCHEWLFAPAEKAAEMLIGQRELKTDFRASRARQRGKTMLANVTGQVSQIAFIGTYIPRRCGIATFTSDLCQAMTGASTSCVAVPVNDRLEGYD